jgi:ABC-type phosphate transport system substrate-binding protein
MMLCDIFDLKTATGRLFASVVGLLLSCFSPPGVAAAQPYRTAIPVLSVPAKPGLAIVRGRYTSESFRLVRTVFDGFPAKNEVDIAFDLYASFGRFCDHDAPFHVVICEGELTPHDKQCWARRFPPGTPQPEAFLVGKLRVLFVVHKENSIQSLDFAGIRKSLNENGKPLQWEDIGGVRSTTIQCFGPPEKTWTRQLVRDKCMARWRDTDRVGIRELQRLGFRDDIVSCTDAKEVLAKVRADRHALGFFAYCEPLTNRDLQGVKVLPIAVNAGDKAIASPLDLTTDQAYPLAEPVYLYVHPAAPAVAHDFCKFATGPEAAKIVRQFGLWPEYELDEVRGNERLAEVKAGRGTEIAVCDLTSCGKVLTDLSLEFAKAKAAVQLRFRKGQMQEEAVENLAKGVTELLLADKDIGQGPMAGGQSGANQKSLSPKSIELGRMEAGIIVHPENPLPSLPLEEVRSILCGETKKWPAVRGAAAAMHVFGLKRGDPITQLLKEKLAESGGRKSLKYAAQPDNEKVILAVARDPAAIGFVDLSQLPSKEKSVKLVPVFEGKAAGEQRRGKVVGSEGDTPPNPLSRTLTLYVSPKASQTAKDFAAFLTPEHCKETIARYNLLPPLQVEQPELASRPPFGPLPADTPSADADGSVARAVGLLDDPDAPQGQAAKNESRAKGRKLAAKPEPIIPVPEQPATPEATADSQPEPEKKSGPQPTSKHGTPGLSDEQALWLAGGGVVGGILAAIGVGWLGSPRRKHGPKNNFGI